MVQNRRDRVVTTCSGMRETQTRYADRSEAGRALAEHLRDYENRDDVVVYGLPRGGVPVAFEVAEALDAPLDVLIVRKLGVPGQPELAMGAVASNGVRFFDDELVRRLGVGKADIDRIAREQREEVRARERRFRSGTDVPDAKGATAIVVDDGIATGSTMKASVQALRQMSPSRVIVAVPVASPSACAEMEKIADEVICLSTPQPFSAVGAWYQDFTQTRDEDVRRLLDKARER